jgi:hypothetical protein
MLNRRHSTELTKGNSLSIIKRRPKENLKPISFRLPESVAERLSSFADFINVPQSEIVTAALNHVRDSDREFAAPSKIVIHKKSRRPCMKKLLEVIQKHAGSSKKKLQEVYRTSR